ncbi:MAG: ABC transporter ATP-binding protein [Thaumarchaeota archaeon]|jgi:peptide/nickel transport system ATP-binding protein|nr:ABC transporter ATP-binding protein [Candidatus Geocrenenecus arthurdayi]
MVLLELNHLRLYYKTVRGIVRAVDDVDLNVEPGEAVGVVGESGCGKTSMANAIIKMLPSNVALYDGRIILDGLNIVELPEDEVRRKVRWRQISIVFQGAMNVLNPVIKVGHQVAEPLIIHAEMDRDEAYKIAMEKMKLVGLHEEVFNRYPHELSGGMKQRVVIAMALVMNPKIVILDEPTSALDVSIQAQIMNLLKKLKRELNISMIFITHDIALASDISDKIAVMYAGQVVEIGSAEQVLLSPKHPYTQKLLKATPKLTGEEKPEFIPGTPPDLVNPPSGCRFHPRCPYVMDICREKEPGRFEPEKSQRVMCWLYGGENE